MLASVGRKLAQKGYDKERLPQFDRIPSSKLQVLPLIVKVFTEAWAPSVITVT